MKKIEINNSEYEECISYYYVTKSELNEINLVKAVAKEESLDISLFSKKQSLNFRETDFKIFSIKAQIFETIIAAFLIDKEWNFELMLIETRNYNIIRIWETSA